MENVIGDLSVERFYIFILSLSVVVSAISMLMRVFNHYEKAKVLSLVSFGLASLSFMLSFWLNEVNDPKSKMFVTSLLSMFILFLIIAKNSDKHIKENDSHPKQVWVMFLTILYFIMANSLTAFLYL